MPFSQFNHNHQESTYIKTWPAVNNEIKIVKSNEIKTSWCWCTLVQREWTKFKCRLNVTRSTLWVKKLDPFSFEHNFGKFCPILIPHVCWNKVVYNIFHCFRQKLSAHKHIIEFPTSPIVCCCTAATTLKNATTYISSQKLLNKSATHAVISLLLQSRKFWWYLLLTFFMLLHDVIMTS